MNLKRYEVNDTVVKRKLYPIGEYKDNEYQDVITLDYVSLSNSKVAVCLGFSPAGKSVLMNQFESYALEVAAVFIRNGMVESIRDVDFYIIAGLNDFVINRVTFNEKFQVESWNAEQDSLVFQLPC